MSHYLKLVKAGKVKTYWTIEHSDGSKITTKKFENIGRVKSSCRVRFKLVKESGNDDTDPPQWLVESSQFAVTPDASKGLWAVHYDAATKTEIEREDLSSYLMMAVLSN